jgi:hypothetical protein
LFSFTISPALQRVALRIAFEGSSAATVLMPARASSRKRQKQPHSWIAQCARAVAILLVAVVMLPGMISDVEDHQLPLSISAIPDADPEVFILAITESESATITEAADTSTEDEQLQPHSREACLLEATLALSLVELPSPPINLIPLLTMSSSGPEMLDNVVALLPSSSGADLISYAGRKWASDFGYAYRDLVKRAQYPACNASRMRRHSRARRSWAPCQRTILSAVAKKKVVRRPLRANSTTRWRGLRR